MAELATEVSRLNWYHTIELPGRVVTPGYFDTRAGAKHVPLPESLAGKRCLDIGTCDGFWAFELERRDADEVVGVDLADPRKGDWPGTGPPAQAGDPGRAQRTFGLARQALGSSVERLDLSVYELSPERVGLFDFVFIGNILLHLRDPIGALMAARSVVGGELLSVDVVSLIATLKSPRSPSATLSPQTVAPFWWIPNLRAYRDYFIRAGYEIVDRGRPFFIPFGDGFHERPPLHRLLASPREALFWAFVRPIGSSTSWVRARPASAAAGAS